MTIQRNKYTFWNLNGFLGRANPICKERAHSVFFGAVLNGGNVFLRRYGGASPNVTYYVS